MSTPIQAGQRYWVEHPAYGWQQIELLNGFYDYDTGRQWDYVILPERRETVWTVPEEILVSNEEYTRMLLLQ